MDSALRYEIIDTVAVGEFTTVYRARDRKLAREVALKQIHQQYLVDPEQLERYWDDLRSLAKLEHPHILTVVELIPSRGRLVSELMRGSLKQNARSEPVDHEFLRAVLAACLDALEFLHANDLIHGDVKPSNILLDRQDRVKLGDFGLANRAGGEYESPLEADAKYMAPEQLSERFGPVRRAADLYSLGFSAYELLLGPRFELLFPELADHGSDKQAAWAAWHTDPDRSLAEIGDLLDDVPEDLRLVIQRLAQKDPARRYASAAEALAELRPAAAPLDQPPEPEEPPKPEPTKLPPGVVIAKRRRRIQIGIVGVLTAVLGVLIALLVLPSRHQEQGNDVAGSVRGVIRSVLLEGRKIELELSGDDGTKQFAFKQGDKFFINKEEQHLRDLQAGDEAVISTRRDESGREISVVSVFRPETHKGRVQAVTPQRGEFTLKVTEGADRGREFTISVSRNVPIVLNGELIIDGRPVELNDLREGDHLLVRHKGEVAGHAATELEVKRIVTLKGHIRNLNAIRRELTVSKGSDDREQPVVLEFAPNCEVTINDQRSRGQEAYKPTDLRPGDQVTVTHDTQVVSVDARRARGQRGVVTEIGYSTRTLDVLLEDDDVSRTFRVDSEAAVSLGGELIELGDLRVGDLVEITRHADGIDSPVSLTVAATRPPDPKKWAILVGIQDYDDAFLSPLEYPLANTRLLRQMLVNCYGVPGGQVKLLEDVGRDRLEQGVEELLGKVGSDGELLVYVAGHAYRNTEGKVYLAPKDLDLKRLTASGVPLRWLVDQLEHSAAKTKLLLLDCCNQGKGTDLAMQPSSARMLRSLAATAQQPALKTIWAVASCDNGQRGYAWPTRGCGLFAACLAEAYSGKADADKNTRVEAAELFTFLKRAMASAGAEVEHIQEPVLFSPR